MPQKGEYIRSGGDSGTVQHDHCTTIKWNGALSDDLVFYNNDDYIGIVGGRDENVDLLIIHCANGWYSVVITGLEEFLPSGGQATLQNDSIWYQCPQ